MGELRGRSLALRAGLVLLGMVLGGLLALRVPERSEPGLRLLAEGRSLVSDPSADPAQLRRALALLGQAEAHFAGAGDSAHRAETLRLIGGCHFSLGDWGAALAAGRSGLHWSRVAGDLRAEARIQLDLGVAHHTRGETGPAVAALDRALALFRRTGERAGEADALQDLAYVDYSVGEITRARERYEQTLALRRELGDPMATARTLHYLALAERNQGDHARALFHHEESLRLFRAQGDRFWQSAALKGIGVSYLDLGELEPAARMLGESLALAREVGRREGQLHILCTLASVHSAAGEVQAARRELDEALRLAEEMADPRGELRVRNEAAALALSLGESRRAAADAGRALALARELDDRAQQAVALRTLGRARLAAGQPREAADLFVRALPLARAVGDRSSEAATLAGLAETELRRGRLETAREHAEAAVGRVEALRGRIALPGSRTSFLAAKQDYYELLIDILLRLHAERPAAGYAAAALETAERSRARGLLDLLGEARSAIRQGSDPALLAREAALRRQLDEKESRRLQLASGGASPELAAVSRAIDALVVESESLERQIRARSPRWAALTRPRPVSAREIRQRLLDSSTVLLEFSLGRERSVLWRVTSTQLEVFPLPGREEIEAAARRLHGLLSARGERLRFESEAERSQRIARAEREIPAAAAALGRMILPLGDRLGQTDSSRLLVIAPGPLQLVPFALLPDAGGQPLLARHEIVTAPSASVLLSVRRELAGRAPAPKGIAVFADPVFGSDDSRLRGERQGRLALAADLQRSATDARLATIPRLAFTGQEADRILGLAEPEGGNLRAVGFACNLATVRSPEIGRYRILHFATHALLNHRHPDLSGIVLSLVDERGRPRDGFLRLHDIYNLRLGADLVVLSACRTALGKEIQGEGLVGLTRGFFYAGSPRVVASLWNAPDEGTAELMARFYRALLQEKLPPAAALRKAQLSLAAEPRWRSPYYWASMVFQGDWTP